MGGRLLSPLRWRLPSPFGSSAPAHSRPSGGYRPEIDGLRALAVLAVVLHHLHPPLLPGGFLGVDVFFVISGTVVTGSLLERPERSAGAFLQGFYTRRFRRLLPALLLMVLVCSGLFALVASPYEDGDLPSLRTGLMAIFGVANLYLMRQSTHYFSADNNFNPFLHTWSLSVEEQYYLLWPWLVLLCGLGRGGRDPQRLRRLAALTTTLLVASLLFYGHLNRIGQQEAAFFLLPARFWELALGCLVALAHRPAAPESPADGPTNRGGLAGLGSLLALLALLGLLALPEGLRAYTSPAIAAATALLLMAATPARGVGRALAHPALVAIGLLSYSLYLWHWPLIVLLRWTFGLGALTLVPLLLAMAGVTLLSNRFERHCRYAPPPAWAAARPWLPFPLLAMAAAAVLLPLQGPLRTRIYTGSRVLDPAQTSNNKRIEGTTIRSATCFLDPTAPLLPPQADRPCRSEPAPGQPTLFFEGDSHTHALIPLGAQLVRQQGYGVSFLARGGCPIPYFEPWHQEKHAAGRYRLCRDHARSRLAALAAQLRPGDQVLLASSYANYFGPDPQNLSGAMAASYRQAMGELAGLVAARGARLVLFLPLPSFQQSAITAPLSLCRPEWFRPGWALGPACTPVRQARERELRRSSAIRSLQQELGAGGMAITLFDPFATLCAEGQRECSTVLDGQLLYQDGSHLSAAGAQQLVPSLLRLLRTPTPNPAPSGLPQAPEASTAAPAPAPISRR